MSPKAGTWLSGRALTDQGPEFSPCASQGFLPAAEQEQSEPWIWACVCPSGPSHLDKSDLVTPRISYLLTLGENNFLKHQVVVVVIKMERNVWK